MVERKDRSLYLAMVKNGEAENFFGAVVAKEPVEQVLALHHLDLASLDAPQLEVALQGVTTGVHQVLIQLNGHDVGTMIFPGKSVKRSRFSFVKPGSRTEKMSSH